METRAVSVGSGRIELVVGNIVEQEADAIVNAANTKLLGGGGVDGAIHRAAGPGLVEACRALPADEDGRRCPTGDCRVTPAFELRARFVIHAVGPFYNDRESQRVRSETLLRHVHQRALELAREHGCASIAFPAISTGAYRFPVDSAAAIALDVAAGALEAGAAPPLIRFVLYRAKDFAVFSAALDVRVAASNRA